MPAPPPLRRYQREPFIAALRAAEAHDADVIVMRFPRQSGKNEVSARFEATLMTTYRHSPLQGIKAAPTREPQAVRSLKRLANHLRLCGFRHGRDFAAATDSVRLGLAEWWFGSGEPDANVVGATASLALEFDEAQAFDQEKHDKDYSPMAASTAAARIYYGTAWTDFDVLETARQDALAREARDGRRRAFDVTWEQVAEEVPAYGRFVEAERTRLGHTAEKPHPIFASQYLLQIQAGAGRLFTPAQLAALQGDHDACDGPLSASHNTYVAGLDVGGADLAATGNPDETVLTIGRSRYPGRGRSADAPIVQAVRQYAWAGLNHDAARGEITRLLEYWRVSHVAVDATGIGEPLAGHLLNLWGARRVTPFKFTRETKSALGYDIISAANTNSLTVWKPDGPHHAALWSQIRAARRTPLPGGRLGWDVDPRDGHDDRLISLALMYRAAQRGRPQRATTRTS